MDNYVIHKTPKIKAWFARQPHYQRHPHQVAISSSSQTHRSELSYRDLPPSRTAARAAIDNATTTSILCCCFNLSRRQPRALSTMIAREIASRMPASGYNTIWRTEIKSNRLLVAAVRLGTVCGYS